MRRVSFCGRFWTPTLLLALVAFADSALAKDDWRWSVRATGGVSITADDAGPVLETLSGPIVVGTATHGVSDGSGGGVSLELLATQRLGVELGVSWFDYDTTFTLVGDGVGLIGALVDTETVLVETFLGGVNYHFWPQRRVDLSVGAFFAMSKPEDLFFNTESGRRDKLAFDDDTGFGVLVRADVLLSSSGRWLLTAEARAASLIFEGEFAGQDLDLDPTTVSIGFGYRW